MVLLSCKKDPLIYTSRMEGPHAWHGNISEFGRTGVGVSADTTYNISFDASIVVIDKNTIILPNASDTLKYSSSDRKNKTITFKYSYSASYAFQYIRDLLVYNYSNNTISYYRYSSTQGHGSILNVITP